MVKEKEIPLKVEAFSNGENSDFLIHSKAEIQQVLRTICERRTRSALYYDNGKRFFLTMLLKVNENGVWIDPAPRAQDNRNIIDSDEIVFVSTHNNTKVQFIASEPFQVINDNNAAIFLPLPPLLLRLQRRDNFRLDTLPQHPLKCVIKPVQNQQHIKHEVTVADISMSGLSLVCSQSDLELKPGNIYPNCEIKLPEIGTLTATLQVKNTFDITSRTGKINRRAGCEFVKPDWNTTMPLQRYVAQMQLHSAAMGANK